MSGVSDDVVILISEVRHDTNNALMAIFGYLDERNLAPKRYVWKAKGEEILAKIKRARERLNQIIKRT